MRSSRLRQIAFEGGVWGVIAPHEIPWTRKNPTQVPSPFVPVYFLSEGIKKTLDKKDDGVLPLSHVFEMEKRNNGRMDRPARMRRVRMLHARQSRA